MSSSTPYTKFGFDTEFFELVQTQKGMPVSSGGSASKSQTEALRQQAYDEGYTTGLAEGQNQAQADLAQVQQHLQNTLMALQKAQTEREEHLLTQTISLLRTTLHHLVGHAVQHYAAELFENHLRTLLPLLTADEALTLRVHPAARGYHEKLGLPQAAIMGLPMHIKTDSSLGPADAVVEWANGGVEAKLAQHLEAIDALLAGAGAALLPVEPRPAVNLAPQATPAAPPAAAAAAPDAPTSPAATPATPAPTTPNTPATDLESAATSAARERARQLLGDDDDLVDALK